jgi:hypothetical protein
LRQPCTTVCDRARRYTTVYGSRIAPYTEHRCFPFNHLSFLYDLRIRNPFPAVSVRVHASYTEAVHDFCISPFFSANDRLRSCMFDLRGKSWLQSMEIWAIKNSAFPLCFRLFFFQISWQQHLWVLGNKWFLYAHTDSYLRQRQYSYSASDYHIHKHIVMCV